MCRRLSSEARASSPRHSHVCVAGRAGAGGDHASRGVLGGDAASIGCSSRAPAVRLAAMVAVGVLSLWVAYRYLLRRAFVPLPAASLAVLLERRFSQLKDHLLTTVDLADRR